MLARRLTPVTATPKHSVNGSAPIPNDRRNTSVLERRTNTNPAKSPQPKAGSSKQANQTTKVTVSAKPSSQTPREVIELSDSDEELLPARANKPQASSKAAPNHPSTLLPLFKLNRDKIAVASAPPTKGKGKDKVAEALGPVRDGHVFKMAQRFDQPTSPSGSRVNATAPKKQFVVPAAAARPALVDSDSNETTPLPLSIRKPRPRIYSPESSDAGSRTLNQTAKKMNGNGASLLSTKGLTPGSAVGAGQSTPRYTPPDDNRPNIHSSPSVCCLPFSSSTVHN